VCFTHAVRNFTCATVECRRLCAWCAHLMCVYVFPDGNQLFSVNSYVVTNLMIPVYPSTWCGVHTVWMVSLMVMFTVLINRVSSFLYVNSLRVI
jgi:hypothetical protein